MVKARGPSKGADWLAKERGLIRPRFTTSCAKLFADKGNPWLTDREQSSEFPLNRSSVGDQPMTEFERKGKELRNKLAKALGQPEPIDFNPPRPRIVVDPDMDMFTKADRAKAREPYVDPKGSPIVRDHDRWRANLLLKLNRALQPVNCRDKIVKPKKVKGSFYRFDDVKDKIPDQTEYDKIKKAGGRPLWGSKK